MRVPGRPAPGAAATRTSARPSVSVYSAVPDGSLPLLMYGSMALEASAPAGDTVRGLAACFGLHRPDRHRVHRSGRSATAGPRRTATASRRRVGIPRHPARQHPRPDRNGRRKGRHHDRRRRLKPQAPLAQRRGSTVSGRTGRRVAAANTGRDLRMADGQAADVRLVAPGSGGGSHGSFDSRARSRRCSEYGG